MRAAIVITLEGEIQVVTQEGDFLTGKAKIEALLKLLAAEDLAVNLEGQIETHNHGDEEHLNRMNRVTGKAIGSSH